MPKFLSSKAKKLRLMIGIVVGAVLLLAGLGAVVALNKSSQDLRQQAAGEKNYIACDGLFGNASQCPYNYICSDGKCIPRAEAPQSCSKTKPCPAGSTCWSAYGVPQQTGLCTPDNQPTPRPIDGVNCTGGISYCSGKDVAECVNGKILVKRGCTYGCTEFVENGLKGATCAVAPNLTKGGPKPTAAPTAGGPCGQLGGICPQGLNCVANRCRVAPTSHPTSHPTSVPGQSCDGVFTHCSRDLACVKGKCVAPSSLSCDFFKSCPNGFVCKDGKCATR